jgi:hypothetical protein
VTLEVTGRRLVAALAGLLLILTGLGVYLSVAARRYVDAKTDIEQRNLAQPGDAPAAVQAGVQASLRDFQDGYVRRDPQAIDSFMSRLFERSDDLVILGTGPGEWARGYPAASDFVLRDWKAWGDFRFEVDKSIVSSYGDVAWVATVGTLHRKRYDRPVRFSAVLTRKGERWFFRQMQFQYEDRAATPTNLLLLRP